MYTYQMVGIADENGKTYECLYGEYNKEEGFKFNESIEPIIEDKGWREVVNILFHEDLWKLKQDPVKKMTLEELEKELGYKVKIVEEENLEKKEKKQSDEDKKEINEVCKLFNNLFGIDLDPKNYY